MKEALLTPISRRIFNNEQLEENIHMNYPEAMKKLAIQEKVHLIDIYKLSRDWLISLGDEKSKEFFMHFAPGIYKNYPDGLQDDTHLVTNGARVIASMVSNDLKS